MQGFPDGFQFEGAMNAAFRQIGNAVPPLLSFTIAAKLKNILDEALVEQNSVNQIIKSEHMIA